MDINKTILLGPASDKVYLYVHGFGGNKSEAENFAKSAVPAGYQVLGVDLPVPAKDSTNNELLPWVVIPYLNEVYEYMSSRWKHIAVRANSIGSWFSMLAFTDKNIERALFVSPVIDMEKLISNMMLWASVSEEQLEHEKEIHTSFGHTLLWDFYSYAKRNHAVPCSTDTRILYPEKDDLTSYETASNFASAYDCKLNIMKNGEHWFHTEEQVNFMNEWEKDNIY